AKLLGKCMDLDPSLITFSDIAYISYGRKARIATSILFTMELLAANAALGRPFPSHFCPLEDPPSWECQRPLTRWGLRISCAVCRLHESPFPRLHVLCDVEDSMRPAPATAQLLAPSPIELHQCHRHLL